MDTFSDSVQLFGTLGTLVIAIATLVIAWRQTQIADEQKRLGEMQATAAVRQADSQEIQARLDGRLAELEEARSRPVLAFTNPIWMGGPDTSSVLSVKVVNVGSLAALDVWIEQFELYGQSAAGSLGKLSIIAQQRIDVLQHEFVIELVLSDASRKQMPYPEGVLTCEGTFKLPSGQEVPISYKKAG